MSAANLGDTTIQAGIGEGLIRISVGIEDSADLIRDLERELAASLKGFRSLEIGMRKTALDAWQTGARVAYGSLRMLDWRRDRSPITARLFKPAAVKK